ncbi:signaling related protein [Purpureocillium lilacinum]|uniref:Signaling related protein n=1 Tax=Purpureocillium lilacinum TaxID=33203 RepID=A0A2U3EH20_PURLI|nr:signaling related protein [Purpureocillium lilacinum]
MNEMDGVAKSGGHVIIGDPLCPRCSSGGRCRWWAASPCAPAAPRSLALPRHSPSSRSTTTQSDRHAGISSTLTSRSLRPLLPRTSERPPLTTPAPFPSSSPRHLVNRRRAPFRPARPRRLRIDTTRALRPPRDTKPAARAPTAAMAGPTSPSTEGPTFAPPSLPAGWIAQWDGASKKYYYVQLATGVSQWEVPTQAVHQTGNTPAHESSEHPYGQPPPGSAPGSVPPRPPELITHPDGSQTVKHPDGTMEPIMADGSRGLDGPNGDRGLGSMAMNALLGGKGSGGGGGGSHGGNPLGSLANQFLGGGSHGGSSGGGGKNNAAGKLVGQLASNLFSPSSKPEQPQNYHGGQNTGHGQHQGGLAGAVFGGVAHMFGGKESHGSGQNYGYSGAGTGNAYSGGEAPTYHPPGSGPSSSTHTPSTSQPSQHQQQQQGSSHHQGSQNQSHQSQSQQSYGAPSSGGSQGHQPPHSQSPYGGSQSYGGQHGGQHAGQHGGNGSYSHQPAQPSYGTPPAGGHQPSYGQSHQGPPSSYSQGPPGGYQQGPPGGYSQGAQGGYSQGPPGGYNQGSSGGYASSYGGQQQQQHQQYGGQNQAPYHGGPY